MSTHFDAGGFLLVVGILVGRAVDKVQVMALSGLMEVETRQMAEGLGRLAQMVEGLDKSALLVVATIDLPVQYSHRKMAALQMAAR